MLHHQSGGPSRSKTMRTKPYTATLVMTPLMRAETWLGAAGWASGSHTCNGTRPALEPVPTSTRTKTTPGRTAVDVPDLGEGVAAAAAGKQAEGQQQRQRAEARHDDVDEARAAVLGIAVVGHHQRPGRQRHELPGDQEGEGVVRQDDEVHGAEECRIEGQHTPLRRLVLAVADGIEAGAGAAEVQHHEKERGQRVHAEVRADPRQPDGEQHLRCGSRSRQQLGAGEPQDGEAGRQAYGVDQTADTRQPLQGHSEHARAQQHGHARERQGDRHEPSPSPYSRSASARFTWRCMQRRG